MICPMDTVVGYGWPVSDEMRFAMDRLVSYDDASLIAELQRVAVLLPDGPITTAAYDLHALAASSTVRRRFGGWQQALGSAGLAHRYAGTVGSVSLR